MRQFQFQKSEWNHRFCYGGSLRNSRAGRKERPLSSKEPIHLVFKANRDAMAGGLRSPRRYCLISELLHRYSRRFFIKLEQISIQNDHIHLVVRMSRRSMFQNFLRVVSGQIAQRFLKGGLMRSPDMVTDTPGGRRCEKKLWLYRPFTRVIRGYKAYRTVQDYVQLNELEATRKIPFQKNRLRGLTADGWNLLWS